MRLVLRTYPVTLLSLGSVRAKVDSPSFYSLVSSLVVELAAHIFLSQILYFVMVKSCTMHAVLA